jgi:hypothetical protein
MKHGLLFVAILVAAVMNSAAAKDQRFLVITTHTPETCLAALDAVDARGEKFLSKFDWGCMVNDHTGYAVIEAKDMAAARAMLPSELKDARIVKIGKFTREQIRSFHEKMMKK